MMTCLVAQGQAGDPGEGLLFLELLEFGLEALDCGFHLLALMTELLVLVR
jgi:hypothetical protein